MCTGGSSDLRFLRLRTRNSVTNVAVTSAAATKPATTPVTMRRIVSGVLSGSPGSWGVTVTKKFAMFGVSWGSVVSMAIVA